jgi:hypothetical protein
LLGQFAGSFAISTAMNAHGSTADVVPSKSRVVSVP